MSAMHLLIIAIMSLEFYSHIAILLIYFVNLPFWLNLFLTHRRNTFQSLASLPSKQKISSPKSKSFKNTWRVPFKYTWVLIVVCWLAGENYPFSNFPMYSSQKSFVSSVFLTTSDGELLPTLSYFGVTSPMFTKYISSWHKSHGVSVGKNLTTSRFHLGAAEDALLHFYRGAPQVKKDRLDAISPIQLREHYVELLPSGEIFEKRQVLAELDRGEIMKLPERQIPSVPLPGVMEAKRIRAERSQRKARLSELLKQQRAKRRSSKIERQPRRRNFG